jgi:hypothetical protein
LLKGGTHLAATMATTTHAGILHANHVANKMKDIFNASTQA